jgi:hypothetical protein
MSTNKAAIAIFLSIFVLVRTGNPQDIKNKQTPPPSERRTFGPLEKSLLLPGWGQLSQGRILEGIFFLGSSAFCLYEILLNNHRGNENYTLYQTATNLDDAVRYRALTERYDRRRNQFLLTGGAVWALNLLDIILIVKAKDAAKNSLTFRIVQDGHEKFAVMAGYRF